MRKLSNKYIGIFIIYLILPVATCNAFYSPYEDRVEVFGGWTSTTVTICNYGEINAEMIVIKNDETDEVHFTRSPWMVIPAGKCKHYSSVASSIYYVTFRIKNKKGKGYLPFISGAAPTNEVFCVPKGRGQEVTFKTVTPGLFASWAEVYGNTKKVMRQCRPYEELAPFSLKGIVETVDTYRTHVTSTEYTLLDDQLYFEIDPNNQDTPVESGDVYEWQKRIAPEVKRIRDQNDRVAKAILTTTGAFIYKLIEEDLYKNNLINPYTPPIKEKIFTAPEEIGKLKGTAITKMRKAIYEIWSSLRFKGKVPKNSNPARYYNAVKRLGNHKILKCNYKSKTSGISSGYYYFWFKKFPKNLNRKFTKNLDATHPIFYINTALDKCPKVKPIAVDEISRK